MEKDSENVFEFKYEDMVAKFVYSKDEKNIEDCFLEILKLKNKDL